VFLLLQIASYSFKHIWIYNV